MLHTTFVDKLLDWMQLRSRIESLGHVGKQLETSLASATLVLVSCQVSINILQQPNGWFCINSGTQIQY